MVPCSSQGGGVICKIALEMMYMKDLNDYERGLIEASIDTDGYISLYVKKDEYNYKRGWYPRLSLGFTIKVRESHAL